MTRIALVAPSIDSGGGVSQVVYSLGRIIRTVTDFKVRYYSLATSSTDSASSRILQPKSVFSHPTVDRRHGRVGSYAHIGSCIAELEPVRYCPNRRLVESCNRFDLVQVVGGTPAWALRVAGTDTPVLLQVASFSLSERLAKIGARPTFTELWRLASVLAVGPMDIAGLHAADKVLVENETMACRVAGILGDSATELLPPGIDCRFYSPNPNQVEERFILTVGRLADSRKDIRTLLKAYSYLDNELRRSYPLVLVGRSDLSPQDKELAWKLDIADRIMVETDVTDRRLVDLYRSAACYVSPSREEGLGLATLEAMACQTSVVATRTEGSRSIIQDGQTGILVRRGDDRGIAKGIERIIGSKRLRNRLARKAREEVQQRYSLSVMAQQLLRTYRQYL